MRLGEVVQDVIAVPESLRDLAVTGVQDDSRAVRPGDVFVAIQGLTVDGHDFVEAAIKAGAAVVIAQRPLKISVPCLVVENAPAALCLAAARLQGSPAEKMRLLGVTGTNGKTTTTYVMESILRAAQYHPAVIGTVEYRYAQRREPSPFTTPTPTLLHSILRQMREAGSDHLVMEVSSHALQLGRVWGLNFDVAAFSHLTQDHLDLHGGMEAYLQAKLLLFTRHLRANGTAVINIDGDYSEQVVAALQKQRPEVKMLRCSTAGRPEAEAALVDIKHNMEGISADLKIVGGQTIKIHSPLIGAYNADNLLLAAASAWALGIDGPTIATGIAALRGVPGRLERVDEPGQEFLVLVDYAHTPDALERAMAVLRPLCKGRLLTVFGCGGDRDRTKRPLMGAAVARGADIAIVTSDNPRTEEPLSIIEMILDGVRRENISQLQKIDASRGYLVQPDRRLAIEAAIKAARPGDIVLIAGKGHEDYQILGKQKVHFDDREEARKALVSR